MVVLTGNPVGGIITGLVIGVERILVALLGDLEVRFPLWTSGLMNGWIGTIMDLSITRMKISCRHL